MTDHGQVEVGSSGADEMTLRDYALVVRRRKWWVLVPAAVTLLVGLGWSLTRPEQFRASADVLVMEPPSTYSLGQSPQPMQPRTLNNELQRAGGSAILDVVRAQVGDEPHLSVQLAQAENSDVFVFIAESGTAEVAADAANAYADVFIADRRGRLTDQIDRNIEVLEGRIAALDGQIERADASEDVSSSSMLVSQRESYIGQLEGLRTSLRLAETSGATVIDAATVPTSPFEPTPMRTGLLALVLGILVGLGVAFLRDRLDQMIRNEEGLRRATGLAVLGVIPKVPHSEAGAGGLVARNAPQSPATEAYRGLRTSIQFLRHDGTVNVVQVTSPKPADGKTTTATNLAIVCARAGQRVVLVDADLRRPRVHAYFGLVNSRGLTNVLLGDELDDVLVSIDGEPHLDVVCSGPIPPEPSELLSSPPVQTLLADLAKRYDLVIVDSPPVLAVADPLVLAGIVDGVVLVASAASTNLRQATDAARLLAQVDAPMLGTVLNAFDPGKGSTYEYRYSYSYG